MKSSFLIGAKILGIYLAYLSILTLFQAVAALFILFSSSSDPFPFLNVVSSGGALLILLIFSYLLLFKTERISSILKVKEDQTDAKPKISIPVGIILIGVYVFSINIGRFLTNLYVQFKEANAGMEGIATYPNSPAFSKDLLISSITILFSLFLIFGSYGIENLINRFNQKRI